MSACLRGEVSKPCARHYRCAGLRHRIIFVNAEPIEDMGALRRLLRIRQDFAVRLAPGLAAQLERLDSRRSAGRVGLPRRTADVGTVAVYDGAGSTVRMIRGTDPGTGQTVYLATNLLLQSADGVLDLHLEYSVVDRRNWSSAPPALPTSSQISAAKRASSLDLPRASERLADDAFARLVARLEQTDADATAAA